MKEEVRSVSNYDVAQSLDDLLSYMHDMVQTIKAIEKRLLPHEDVYSSEYVDQLYGALSLAQGNFPSIGTNRKTQYWNQEYADLDIILSSIRPMLKDNGLAIIQQLRINQEGATILHTRLTHSSGQWIESRVRLVSSRDDTETFTSLLNHQKRNSVMSLLGVTITNDLRDDGGDWSMKESRKEVEKGTSPSLTYKDKDLENELISKRDLEELEYELAGFDDLRQQLKKTFRIDSVADLSQANYRGAIEKIREIKALRKGK